ncbi:MAG TPA: Arc family DNA-binding protein [Rhizomicrobium sp.]|jgi:plasmid stability protein
MPVTLQIRDVPDDIADQLRARAKRNHRSLQGELMAIFESVARSADAPGMQEGQREYRVEALPKTEKRKLTIEEISARAQKRGPISAGGEGAAQLVRRMRDERSAHLMRIFDENR